MGQPELAGVTWCKPRSLSLALTGLCYLIPVAYAFLIPLDPSSTSHFDPISLCYLIPVAYAVLIPLDPICPQLAQGELLQRDVPSL